MRKIKVVIEATVSNEYYEVEVSILKYVINSGDYEKRLLENGKRKGVEEVKTTFEDIN